MSPASSGSLEIEKYIGACLISQTRPKIANGGSRDLFFSRLPGNYVNYDSRYSLQRCNDRWAGGMPLISFANHQRKKPERSLSPKQDECNLTRLAVHTQGAPLILTKSFNRRKVQNQKPRNFQKNSKTETTSGVDTVSVASDESSGSANSDNCLPRIIKPRKRRKKDRKPQPNLNHDGFSTDSTSPDIDNPILTSYNPFIYGLVPENLPLIKTLDDVSEAPKLHHNFEDVEEIEDGIDINGNQSTTICQCRYCDPCGQIWDVDRSCYSPYLTAPSRSFFSSSSSETDCLVHGLSSLSLEEDKKTLVSASGDLEVSTEIVTSLNGHRDIEIKFFSSSSAESVRRILNKDVVSEASVNNEES